MKNFSFSYQDELKFKRLNDTFKRNFKITELYAAYLERFPNLITKEMIDELTSDGIISKEDAIAALLCEFFGIDGDSSLEDRVLIRDYIIPSVKIMHAEKYRENPYYKNIKLPNVTLGSWEFRNECYAPYRAVICNDMIINGDFSEIPPLGFFEEEFKFPAVLEDGNEWMTLTPVDLDTCDEAIEAASGRVVTFGLGLGYYAYMAARKPEVISVTVVEKSEKVIELFKKFVLPRFECADKINIVLDDAFEYAEHTMPKENFDLAFVDTWRDASDGAPMYRKMKALEHLSPNTKFLYWIENFLISRIRAEKFVALREKFENKTLDMSFDEIVKELLLTPN